MSPGQPRAGGKRPAGTMGALGARMFSRVFETHFAQLLSAMFCSPPNSSGSVSAKRPSHA